MPRYKIIIDDEDKAHEAFVNSYRLHKKIQNQLKESPKRIKGTIHTEMNSDCPEGLINCRNCGDPEFYGSCLSNGHCQDCGTKHGIAPDSILLANGYKLELV